MSTLSLTPLNFSNDAGHTTFRTYINTKLYEYTISEKNYKKVLFLIGKKAYKKALNILRTKGTNATKIEG